MNIGASRLSEERLHQRAMKSIKKAYGYHQPAMHLKGYSSKAVPGG